MIKKNFFFGILFSVVAETVSQKIKIFWNVIDILSTDFISFPFDYFFLTIFDNFCGLHGFIKWHLNECKVNNSFFDFCFDFLTFKSSCSCYCRHFQPPCTLVLLTKQKRPKTKKTLLFKQNTMSSSHFN